MRMYGIIGIAVLFLAGAAQAVSTVSTLTGKGLAQARPGEIGPLGPWNEGATGEQGPTLQILDEFDALFQHEVDICPDPWTLDVGESVSSAAQAAEGVAGHSTTYLIHSLDPDTGWGTGSHWNTGARTYSDAGPVNAGISIALAGFNERGGLSTPLLTTQASLVMELVVFPSLAAMMFVLSARLLVLRVSRRRFRSRSRQLLQA